MPNSSRILLMTNDTRIRLVITPVTATMALTLVVTRPLAVHARLLDATSDFDNERPALAIRNSPVNTEIRLAVVDWSCADLMLVARAPEMLPASLIDSAETC